MEISLNRLVDTIKALDEAEQVLMDLNSTPEQRGRASALCVVARSGIAMALARESVVVTEVVQ